MKKEYSGYQARIAERYPDLDENKIAREYIDLHMSEVRFIASQFPSPNKDKYLNDYANYLEKYIKP